MLAQRDVSAVYGRLLLGSGLLSEQAVLAGSGLSADYLASVDYISWRELACLIRNIDASQASPAWAARLGAKFGMSPHGSLGFASLSAPTLGAAFEAVAELMAVRASAIGIELERRDERYIMSLFDRGEIPEVFDLAAEMVLRNMETLASTILGRSPADEMVIYLARNPEGLSQDLIDAFESRLILGGGQNALSIPASWWRWTSPLHDESSYLGNLSKCRELMIARQEQASFAHRVRAVLRAYFDAQVAGQGEIGPLPSLNSIAAGMHLTPRTLIRRLQAEDQSYKEILRDLRREYARSLLRSARLSVAEVGECLGYREPANFGRAFKNWYGTSPAAWRRKAS
jgi:AraC-like DNA-binding protein